MERLRAGTARLFIWTMRYEHRRVYDCRHTFASWAIAGGVQLFYLARIMGTSVAQIDAAYGHLLPDSEDYLRGLLDAFDAPKGGQDCVAMEELTAPWKS